jgi:hypothetical protein
MLDFIPKLIPAVGILVLCCLSYGLLIWVWRWVGRVIYFKTENRKNDWMRPIWMKTIPLVGLFAILPIPLLIAVQILNIERISDPIAYYLQGLINRPAIYLLMLFVIGAAHIGVSRIRKS